jgi:hypothetical protein
LRTERNAAIKVCGDAKEGQTYEATIKPYRERRSLDANRYFWKLLDQIADALHSEKNDLYLSYVKRVGPFKDFTLTEGEAKTFRKAWSMLGIGWPTEQVDYDASGEFVIIRAYYGSSQYNTKQMSRLIDLVVEDAKDLGIETMTPAELERLKEDWRGSN